MGLPLTPAHWLYWTAALAFVLHALHIPRMPTFWELTIRQHLPMAIPSAVFYPLHMLALTCHAAFGALFFTNAVPDPFFDWSVVLWFVWLALVLLATWFYTTPVSFIPVGPLMTCALAINVTLLVLAILYGDTRAWLIGFESLAIAWFLVLTICGWAVTVKLGPHFSEMKDAVAQMTNATVSQAGGTKLLEARSNVPTTRIADTPLLREQTMSVPLSSLQRRSFNA
jgi:hypothetical protein